MSQNAPLSRRECVEAVAAGIGAAGVPATLQVIDSEPPPLLLVIYLSRELPPEQWHRLSDNLEMAFEGRPRPPIVICPPGVRIEAVLGLRPTGEG